jgi:uncharacterized DUF497 family protein
MQIVFEWDRRKASANLRKHKVSFEEAREVFEDVRSVTFRDAFHSNDEERLITIGMSTSKRVLLVVHTETYQRPDSVIIRIITSRKASRSEREAYEKD